MNVKLAYGSGALAVELPDGRATVIEPGHVTPIEDERAAVIAARDPFCRGVVLLGLEAPVETLKESFAAARAAGRVRGFAVGRTIFADAVERWFNGEIGDEAAIDDMASKFGALVDLWLSFDRPQAS